MAAITDHDQDTARRALDWNRRCGVVFLASDAAGMVSGATYDVTAGDSARNTA